MVALLALVTLFLCMAFCEMEKKDSGKLVYVYGVVYMKGCNTKVYQYHFHKIVDEKDRFKAEKDLEQTLRTNYPAALDVIASSSSSKYWPSATNVCIIKWKGGTTKCSYPVVLFCFGKSQSEAFTKAIALKKMWADKDADYSIVEQLNW